jgi:hypothetical protein
VDVRGDSKGRLGLAQLFSQSPSQTFGTVFSVNTDIKLQTTLAVAGNIKAMPKLRANLIIDWDWQYGQKLNAPKVDLTNLAMDVGSLVNDFLLPIADRLSGMVSPFKPFVDMMLTPIGGMAFTKMIGIENTPLGLLNGLLRFKGKPQIPADFFKAVQFIGGLPSQIRSWGNTGWIELGSLQGFGSGNLSSTPVSTGLPLDLQAKFNDMAAKSTGGSSSAARSGFKMLEYIKSIDNWKAIFSGGDAVLFSYELPLLVNLQPAGEYLAEDYYRAGGLPAVVAELVKMGKIKDAITAHLSARAFRHVSSRPSVGVFTCVDCQTGWGWTAATTPWGAPPIEHMGCCARMEVAAGGGNASRPRTADLVTEMSVGLWG